jgi:hypothetical protein
MLFKFSYLLIITCIFVSSFVWAQSKVQKSDIEDISSYRELVLDRAFEALIQKHNINTAGVAVLKNRKVVWQKPG